MPDVPSIGHPSAIPFETQRFICEQLGHFKTTHEIIAATQVRFHLEITASHISSYRHSQRWQPLISRARAEYLNRVLDVPIANKMIRLERLEELYQYAAMDADNPSRREEAREHLRAAREEMKEPEKSGNTNVYIHQQIAQLDTTSLEQRRREIVERLANLGGIDGVSEAGTAVRDGTPAQEGTAAAHPTGDGADGR